MIRAIKASAVTHHPVGDGGIRQQEIASIMAALRKSGNRKGVAAQMLGYSRAKL